jgi:hypothetical protein
MAICRLANHRAHARPGAATHADARGERDLVSPTDRCRQRRATDPKLPAGALATLDETLDLAKVRMKLADPDEGQGLSEAELDLMSRMCRCHISSTILHGTMSASG